MEINSLIGLRLVKEFLKQPNMLQESKDQDLKRHKELHTLSITDRMI